MRINLAILSILAFLCLTLSIVSASEPKAIEIMRSSQLAFYSQGKDMAAQVEMELFDASGQVRKRELTMLRKNSGSEGEQLYYMYFHAPEDVLGTGFLVHKYPDRNSDRWLFIPAINMVRRIAANDARSSFVGSDFSYEDISGRNVSLDTHRLLREETLSSRACYVVESTPLEETDYKRKISWIDKATYLPVQEEYYDSKGDLYKRFTSDEIRSVQGLPTVVRRTMTNIQTGHRTSVTFANVQYNAGLEEEIFTQRSLQHPPRKWLK